MKAALRVLAAGALAACAAHLAWYRLNRPAEPAGLEGRLAWMKVELGVSDAQLSRIAALHRDRSPELRALAAEAARLREQDAAFEQARVSTDRVDFVSFAQFLNRERALQRSCAAALRELASASGELMTPEQRARYIRVLAPALSPAS